MVKHYATMSTPKGMAPQPTRARRTHEAMLLETASQLAELLHSMGRKSAQQQRSNGQYQHLQDDQQRHMMGSPQSISDSVGVLPLKSLRIGR